MKHARPAFESYGMLWEFYGHQYCVCPGPGWGAGRFCWHIKWCWKERDIKGPKLSAFNVHGEGPRGLDGTKWTPGSSFLQLYFMYLLSTHSTIWIIDMSAVWLLDSESSSHPQICYWFRKKNGCFKMNQPETLQFFLFCFQPIGFFL